MEGPSIVIATEELARFKNKTSLKVRAVNSELDEKLQNQKFLRAQSWGKHLILTFRGIKLRIHFLMFGSYRIDKPRVNLTPKLELKFETGSVYFYSCAIKELTQAELKAYDFSLDLMSQDWNPRQALKSLKQQPSGMLCDLLMDQSIFSGLGNIMKNEILFRQRLHPEAKVKDLSDQSLKALIKDAETYAWLFYEWKKKNVLKRNWLIMRQKRCPECGRAVTKKTPAKAGESVTTVPGIRKRSVHRLSGTSLSSHPKYVLKSFISSC